MNLSNIFESTDFVHASGTKEELQVAEFLKAQCEALGVPARLEAFRVAMGEIESAHLFADGKEITCKAFNCCGSGSVEGELYYMPGTDPVSIAGAKDKIVLMDTQGVGFFVYQDLIKAGAKGIIFQYGNMYYPNTDIDQRDLREAVVGEERKVLCAMIHSSQAVELVKNKVKNIRLEVSQKEYDGESHNVIAELPGRRDEFIVLSAHYDSTSLSHGAYDNMSGCAGLLGIMEQLKGKELNYSLRFVFCGSEERGLLGSKAYVKEHKEELDKIVLNINLDMIGTYMGKFISCVSAEDKLAHYISYMAAEIGFPIEAKTGVYSSDSTPFADSGIPALSFARIASSNVAPIHCRYDVKEVMSMEQLQGDIDFLAKFTERFANAAVCPVAREIPEKIKKELDEKNIPYKKDIEVGIMVETAAASLMADVFAKEAAFFSIGTNDLTQYTMSVDRGNDKVSYLYSTFNPAVLRSIKRIITCGREAGIMVGMCGEAASDPLMIPLLLAFGLNEFSMSASAILFSRKLITGYSVEELQAVADKAMSFATAAEVEAYMKAFAAGQA